MADVLLPLEHPEECEAVLESMPIDQLNTLVAQANKVFLRRVNNERQAAMAEVSNAKRDLHDERNHWLSLADKLKETQLPKGLKLLKDGTVDPNSVVELDVGGTKFKTRVQHLIREEDSYFGAMFSGRWNLQGEDALFIDRDPELFEIIVKYLRTGKFNNDLLSEAQRTEILKEAEFYQLSGIKQYLEWRWILHYGAEWFTVEGPRVLSFKPIVNIKESTRKTRMYGLAVGPSTQYWPSTEDANRQIVRNLSVKISGDFFGVLGIARLSDLEHPDPHDAEKSLTAYYCISDTKYFGAKVRLRYFETDQRLFVNMVYNEGDYNDTPDNLENDGQDEENGEDNDGSMDLKDFQEAVYNDVRDNREDDVQDEENGEDDDNTDKDEELVLVMVLNMECHWTSNFCVEILPL